MQTQRTGKRAEDLALQWLQQHGLRLRERNYQCKTGEIDLVMQEDQSIVFVEVRFRSHEDFGGALESVDRRKQSRLIRTATRYLQQHALLDMPARIDVFALKALDLQASSFRWVRNAIEA